MTICDSAPLTWTEDFKIHSYEIGPSGFASLQSICRFLQEAAGNHAAQLEVSAEDVAARDQMWVLFNLSIRMQRYPRWHETMDIETWPVNDESTIRGYRDSIMRDEHNQVLGRASTMWLLLDKENKRPVKIPGWLAQIARPGHEVSILQQVKEKDFHGTADVSLEFLIRGSDIDWNMHVNNVCYLEWSLEAVPARFRLEHRIAELDASFVAEGKYGDSVVAECYQPQAEQQVFMHRIVEKSTGKVLAMLRLRWEQNSISSDN